MTATQEQIEFVRRHGITRCPPKAVCGSFILSSGSWGRGFRFDREALQIDETEYEQPKRHTSPWPERKRGPHRRRAARDIRGAK